MKPPETRFARVGDDRVAYQVFGDGPIDLVYSSGTFSHVDMRWEAPRFARFFERLASFSRVILFDRRGSGVSDPLPGMEVPTWEQGVQDCLAVMAAAGCERAGVMGVADAAPMSILLAATHPDRVSSLMVQSASARWLRDDDYPEGLPPETADTVVRVVEETWGTEDYVRLVLPSVADDDEFRIFYAKYLRACAAPKAISAFVRELLRLDIRAAVPLVQCPTMVVAYAGMQMIPPEQGRWIADRIPGARFELIEGDLGTYFADQGATADLAEEFFTGAPPEKAAERVLSTVLFTDIAGSTDRAAELGDRKWREVLDRHDEVARRQLERHGGRLVKSTGDGLLATFDGPAKAIRSAFAIGQGVRALGLDLRTGVHTGEVELRGEDVGGIAVHFASRVMSAAEPGEVLCSRTVKDLVMGSEITFADRGTHELKGIPGEWQLFSVELS